MKNRIFNLQFLFNQKNIFFALCLLFFNVNLSHAQVATVEAETGVMTGVLTGNSGSGFTGTYVTGFDASTDKLVVSVNVNKKGFYKIVVRYKCNDNKTQYIEANATGASSLFFPKSTSFTDLDAGKYLLENGNNTITISNSWGWVDIDKFTFYTAERNIYNITPDLIDPLASVKTKELYNYLYNSFGKKVISGHTSGENYTKIKTQTDKSPLLKSWDFTTYTEGYPYNWSSQTNSHAFGAKPDGSTQAAIDWYNSTNKKGIVNFHWHWCSPSDGTVGKNTFSTEFTNFDIREAVKTGTTQNTLILRDIDVIAQELKKLSDLDIPVLWRPLHEAGGAWFWWGAKGPEACLKMYTILYDRLTNFHGLHNLIWIWSTPEEDWYPGNAKVDIIGYDSYPTNFNYGIQKNTFDRLHKIVDGKKLITMSENGAIPNFNDCLTLDAPWLYFMSWAELIWSANSNNHINEVFNNDFVISLESTEKTAALSSPVQTLTLVGAEGETSIAINSTRLWKTSTNQDWLAVESVGLGNNLLKIYFTANPTGANRTADITLTAEGLSPVTISVTQVKNLTPLDESIGIDFSVFPIPTNRNLYINGLTRPTIVSIISLNGILIKQAITDKSLDVSDLNSGTYILKLTTEKGFIVRRFVKQ